MAAAEMVSVDEIIGMLAPVLGSEKSQECIYKQARERNLLLDGISIEDARAILDDLSHTPGLIGLSARFARDRFRRKNTAPSPPKASAPTSQPAPPPSSKASVASPSTQPGSTVSPRAISRLLSKALGEVKSEEVVAQAMAELNLSQQFLNQDQALLVIDHLATAGGLVGVTARFAKVRFLLNPKT